MDKGQRSDSAQMRKPSIGPAVIVGAGLLGLMLALYGVMGWAAFRVAGLVWGWLWS